MMDYKPGDRIDTGYKDNVVVLVVFEDLGVVVGRDANDPAYPYYVVSDAFDDGYFWTSVSELDGDDDPLYEVIIMRERFPEVVEFIHNHALFFP